MRTLQDFIKHERVQALTIDRLHTMTIRKNIRFREYSKIKRSDTLRSLLGGEGALVILWDNEHDPSVGHYTLLFRYGGRLEYFDPYGLTIQKLCAITQNDPTKLLHILKGHHYGSNRVAMQSRREDVNTCGRFCVTRWNFAEFTLKQFYGVFQYKISRDDLVILFTLPGDFSNWKSVLKDER